MPDARAKSGENEGDQGHRIGRGQLGPRSDEKAFLKSPLMKGRAFMRTWTAGFVLTLCIFAGLPYADGQEKLPNPGEFYDASMALYHKGNFEEAIQGFLTIIRSAPASKLVSYSRY